MTPITVSLVEDDRDTREGLAAWIRTQPDLVLKGAFPNAPTALAAIPVDPPDVVLVDLNLPVMSGIECVLQLRARCLDSGLKVVVLTIYEDANRIFEALKAGANGYLLKRRFEDELRPALQMVMGGGAPLSSEVAARMVAHFSQPGLPAAGVQELTQRQYEILDLLSRGLLYKEIARQLGISVQTVNWHVKQVYDKLHVNTRSQAIAKFLKGRPTPLDSRPADNADAPQNGSARQE